jgi:hypothetical protein
MCARRRRRRGRDSESCLVISHIYKDAWSLAQAKGLPSLIYHEPVLEVRFVRGAAGTMRILTIRDASIAVAILCSLSSVGNPSVFTLSLSVKRFRFFFLGGASVTILALFCTRLRTRQEAGETTGVFPAGEVITTQRAGRIPGMSRPYRIKLLPGRCSSLSACGNQRRVYLWSSIVNLSAEA